MKRRSVCDDSHLVLPLDDDDRHWGGGPAVLGREGLVTVPQNDDLKRWRNGFIIGGNNNNKKKRGFLGGGLFLNHCAEHVTFMWPAAQQMSPYYRLIECYAAGGAAWVIKYFQLGSGNGSYDSAHNQSCHIVRFHFWLQHVAEALFFPLTAKAIHATIPIRQGLFSCSPAALSVLFYATRIAVKQPAGQPAR